MKTLIGAVVFIISWTILTVCAANLFFADVLASSYGSKVSWLMMTGGMIYIVCNLIETLVVGDSKE